MNNAGTFMLGWGALAFCTLGGAVGGYQVFLKQHEINLRENIKLRENQKKQLMEMHREATERRNNGDDGRSILDLLAKTVDTVDSDKSGVSYDDIKDNKKKKG
ncbi:hypothetical protein TrLO_g9873 [Triparma laevis f. longispina]|uniref:Uncharacterized protein n=1 Tax=Triparma laevis f. longispina TaxID=1714387 RepID=A0A9W7FDV5_9STRA|nr:hypothetical protein TrLO_g9873 [Triparma laevis f. longispina]